jgi:hypothetical protein
MNLLPQRYRFNTLYGGMDTFPDNFAISTRAIRDARAS